jgi:23S rRNA pseudouridine2457 synthase
MESFVPKLVMFNKPFRVLSQFTDKDKRTTLSEFISTRGIYPCGRLDYDSEGLLVLTNSGKLQSKISDPKFKLPKTYWVQVEGNVSVEHCEMLTSGVNLKDGLAEADSCKILPKPSLWDRYPPIRSRKSVPDTWLELVISEGRNRQVRRMTAAAGLPTLRLVRVAIGNWRVGNLQPGESRIENIIL